MSMIGNIKIEKKDFPGNGEVLIHSVFSDTLKKDKNLELLDEKTNNFLLSKLKDQEFKGKEDELVSLELNGFYKHIIIIGLGKQKDFTNVKLRNAFANAFLKTQQLKCSSVTTFIFEFFRKDIFEIGKQISLAFHLVNYSFDVFKSIESKKKLRKIHNLSLYIESNLTVAVESGVMEQLEQGVIYGKTLAEGISLTRNLINLPGSHLHPETLEQEAFKIAKESNGKITTEVLDEDECKELGMGAFLGVAQGSEQKPKFIILKYQSSNIKNQNKNLKLKNKKICLIGKSITFDSGGLSLKPSNSMETMKCDMAGGATVLGVFQILSNLLNIKMPSTTSLPDIYGILPACENMPSGNALRPGDVVTAMNKKTIEVLNTDAEGRLTLADALAYVEEKIKPDFIIDFATLTGACMVALGTEIAGMFGNNEKFNKIFKDIAIKEGEELWEMPLHQTYAKQTKSDIADLKNITGKGYGGSITAALFLQEFVKKSKWIHLDIAGPAYNESGQNGVIAKGGTGWGVMILIELLKNLQS